MKIYRVNIYIETGSRCFQKKKRQYAVILECETAKGIATKGKFKETDATYHQAVLQAMAEGMEMLNRSCEAEIHIQDEFITNSVENCLDAWITNDFRNPKGEEIKNREEWSRFARLRQKHLVTVRCGKHAYTDWMLTEMRRKKDGETAGGQEL